MTETTQPYITANPGDLITAQNMNAMQIDIRQDIAQQVAAGVAGKHDIEHATSADQLGGMTLDQITSHVLGLALAEVAKRSGHMQVFCNLQKDVDKIIEHKLRAYPIADVYQLDYFLVVSAKDDAPADAQAQWALFYLYHATSAVCGSRGKPMRSTSRPIRSSASCGGTCSISSGRKIYSNTMTILPSTTWKSTSGAPCSGRPATNSTRTRILTRPGSRSAVASGVRLAS